MQPVKLNMENVEERCRAVVVVSKFANCVWHCTVEPLGFFVFLAFHIYMNCMSDGLYQVVCYRLYGPTDDCLMKHFNKEDEGIIQFELSKWNQALMLALLVSGTLSTIILGAWGDISGRKINLLLALSGLIIGVFPMVIILSYKTIPLWVPVISYFLGGSMGFISLIMVSALAYLSDTIVDNEMLSIRMVCFSVLMSVSTIIGSCLGGVLLDIASLPAIIVIVELLLTVGFFYVLFRLEQTPPNVMRAKMLQQTNNINMDAIKTIQSKSAVLENAANETTALKQSRTGEPVWQTICCLLASAGVLIVAVFRTYVRKRQGHNRTFLFMVTFVLFLKMMCDAGMSNAMSMYVFASPFLWSGSSYSYWKAASGAFAFVGNMGGIVVFKKVCKLRDTTILLIALISGIGEFTFLGLARSTWWVYVAAAVGSFFSLILPVVSSFVAQLMNPDEVGKVFVMEGIVTGLGFILSNVIFNNIYTASLSKFPGSVFLFGGALTTVSLVLILWVHLMVVKQQKVADSSSCGKENHEKL